MSIASEITRLQGVKSDILQAIADKGVTVPAGAGLDDVAGLIEDIPSGEESLPTGYTELMYIEFGGSNSSFFNKSIFRENGYTYEYSMQDNIEYKFKMILPNTGSYFFVEFFVQHTGDWTKNRLIYISNLNMSENNFDVNYDGNTETLVIPSSVQDMSILVRNGNLEINGYKTNFQVPINDT